MRPLTRNQRDHLTQWCAILLLLEIPVILFPNWCRLFFLSLGSGFSIAFLLRVFYHYPGKYEPLILDFGSGLLSFLAVFISGLLPPDHIVRIAFPLLGISPHVASILLNNRIGPSGWHSRVASRR